jgi:hypothetical protein
VKELVYGGFGRITKEVWAKAGDHVLKIEKDLSEIIRKRTVFSANKFTEVRHKSTQLLDMNKILYMYVPVQSVIMLDWIQLSSLDSSSKSIIIGGISLLSMHFSFPYSFSIFNTWSSAFRYNACL